MTIDPTREWITAGEAAFLLGITVNALYIAVNRRKRHLPPAYKYGRLLRFKKSEVMAAVKPMDG